VQRLTGDGTHGRSDRGRGEEWRREQSHSETDRTETSRALADHVVCLFDGEVAFEVFGDDDCAVEVAAAVQYSFVVVVRGVG
jgi:hypothetical protein